ncbi:hypothetical protein [uncultured Sunxiuqinia sp.]|uniref:toxin-antitoxin system YwqK family antitoxin n=1 Tax=uncultured Sunxiuqinia sp. TaxID=1573825 RepID=UPI002AA6F5EB|nr:hypothetical protein [uncultured Sunxiuqinia sp.]
MKIILMLLVLVFLKTGYAQDTINETDKKGQKQGFWVKQLPNGTKIYEGNFKNDKPVGEFKRYHTSGFLKAQLFYPEKSDTVKAELYDLKGKLMAEGQYIGQLKTGHWKFFQKDQLVSEEEYLNNLKHGISKTYYPTGELFEQTSFKYDLKDGIYRAYFKNGKPYMECMMKNAKREGTCKVYYQNGALELDAFYTMGLRDKEWNYYHPNGDFSHSLIYDMGILMNAMVLDSIQQLKFNELEKNKSKLVDPEKFMNDPMQYMQKNNILPR